MSDVPKGFESVIYILSGKLVLKGFGVVEQLNAVLFENEGNSITFEALEEIRIIYLAGEK